MKPDREAIEEFIRITGASELEAIRTLEKYHGNLNDAINAHFADSKRNIGPDTSVSASQDDHIAIDNIFPSPGTVTVDNEDTHTAPITRPAVQDNSYATDSGPSTSILDLLPDQILFEEEMLQAAIDNASLSPGTVTVDNENTHTAPITRPAVQDNSYATDSGPSTSILDRLPDQILFEEEMLQAAIDASKREAKDLDDDDIERVIYLSLETAKEERAKRALGEEVGPSHMAAELERRFEPGSSSGSVHTAKGIVESEGSPSSSPQQPIDHHQQQKESDFSLDEDIERQLAAKEASLPKEPLAEDENVVTLVVRMPDGSHPGRRFLKSQKLQHVFDFIDIGRMVKPGNYRLVRSYPRHVFSCAESGFTLNEVGLTSKQEVLFLELI